MPGEGLRYEAALWGKISSMLDPVDPGLLQEGDLLLTLNRYEMHLVQKAPTYFFRMVHAKYGMEMGNINLRVGSTAHIERYAGHIGYTVYEAYRGKRFAARAVRLLLPLAAKVSLDPVWITCDPENLASRRSCELAGAEFVEIVEVPADCIIRTSGHPFKCRYRLSTGAPSA